MRKITPPKLVSDKLTFRTVLLEVVMNRPGWRSDLERVRTAATIIDRLSNEPFELQDREHELLLAEARLSDSVIDATNNRDYLRCLEAIYAAEVSHG